MRSAASAPFVAVLALPLALLAGCGGSDEAASPSSSTSTPATTPGTPSATPSSPDSAPTTTTTTTGDAGQVVQILVQGRKVTPAPGTVELKVGQKLTLSVTSDVANELHLHGWDVERELQPNQVTTVQVVGQEPGTYELETHDPELLLTKITVR